MRGGARVIDRAPPPGVTDDHGEHGGGGWAWLLTVRGIIEAELVRGLLETAGIVPVHLDATDPSPTSWMFLSGDVNALVRVYVPRAHLDEARLALLERSAPAPEPEPGDRTGYRLRPAWIVIGVLVATAFGWRLFVAACGSPSC
ncbi:MAG TPA: hypothetical protein VGB52_06720 [Actinomycetota bacterium]